MILTVPKSCTGINYDSCTVLYVHGYGSQITLPTSKRRKPANSASYIILYAQYDIIALEQRS